MFLFIVFLIQIIVSPKKHFIIIIIVLRTAIERIFQHPSLISYLWVPQM